jgi:hypothetical protein
MANKYSPLNVNVIQDVISYIRSAKSVELALHPYDETSDWIHKFTEIILCIVCIDYIKWKHIGIAMAVTCPVTNTSMNFKEVGGGVVYR